MSVEAEIDSLRRAADYVAQACRIIQNLFDTLPVGHSLVPWAIVAKCHHILEGIGSRINRSADQLRWPHLDWTKQARYRADDAMFQSKQEVIDELVRAGWKAPEETEPAPSAEVQSKPDADAAVPE